jgi:hypothetical protein
LQRIGKKPAKNSAGFLAIKGANQGANQGARVLDWNKFRDFF